MAYPVPSQMKAIRYNNIRDFELVKIPVPEPRPHEVLIKGIIFFAHPARHYRPKSSGITNLADRIASQIVRDMRNRLTYPW